jgi:hypothetical protein
MVIVTLKLAQCRRPLRSRKNKVCHYSSLNPYKYFATADVLETANDRAWLVKVTNTMSQHWQHQNARAKNHSANLSQNGHALLAPLASR